MLIRLGMISRITVLNPLKTAIFHILMGEILFIWVLSLFNYLHHGTSQLAPKIVNFKYSKKLWGKTIKPVKSRGGTPVPKGTTCPYCGAPHEYLYDNSGRNYWVLF
jgi:hypothetical protein